MKKLVGLFALSVLFAACTRSEDTPPPYGPPPYGQGQGLGDDGQYLGNGNQNAGLDNSQGNPSESIKGTPIYGRTFSLIDADNKQNGSLDVSIEFSFDQQGFLSVTATLGDDAFYSNATPGESKTFVAQNVPYNYSENDGGSIRIRPIIAMSNDASSAPNQGSQSIQIGTGETLKSSGGKTKNSIHTRELVGKMVSDSEFDLMSSIRSTETVIIRRGTATPNLNFQKDPKAGLVGYYKAALIANDDNSQNATN